MKTKNRKWNRFARFENLENRWMMSADAGIGGNAAIAKESAFHNCPIAMDCAAPMAAAPIQANAMPEIRDNPTEVARFDNVVKFAGVPSRLSAQTVATSELHASTSHATAQSNLGDHPTTSSASMEFAGGGIFDAFKRGVRRAKEAVERTINDTKTMVDYYIKEVKERKTAIDRMNDATKITAAKLKPGDVFIFDSNGITRVATKLLTLSSFTHAAIYIGNGEVVEATKDGVVKHSLREAFSDQRICYVLRRDGLNDAQRDKLVNAAKDWEGAKYSTQHLIDCLFGGEIARNKTRVEKLGVNKPAVICTELVQRIFRDAGLGELTNNKYPSPGKIFACDSLKVVGWMRGGQEDPPLHPRYRVAASPTLAATSTQQSSSTVPTAVQLPTVTLQSPTAAPTVAQHQTVTLQSPTAVPTVAQHPTATLQPPTAALTALQETTSTSQSSSTAQTMVQQAIFASESSFTAPAVMQQMILDARIGSLC